ncbi:medium-chain fatty acid-CoA ligase faa2 [Coemansia sp. Benny D115]|nr:medium-chain fatty acid-CoA ligase faa2 [Coemansia sp. Benny D115]
MALADLALAVSAVLAALAAAVYMYYFSPQANQPDAHPLQLAQQASVGATRASSAETAVYRSKVAPHGTLLLSTPSSDAATLRDAFRLARAAALPGSTAIQAIVEGKHQKITAADASARVAALAAGLQRTLGAGAGAAAVLYMESSPELLLAYQACIEAGVVAIPILAAEPLPQVAAILAHSRAPLLLTSSALAIALAASATLPSTLTHAAVVGDLDGSDGASALQAAVRVSSLADLEAGTPSEKEAPVAPSAPAYVLYEPQQSGDSAPRGVVITHANALAAVAGLAASLPEAHALGPKDAFLSAAPLANAANLALINVALARGCSVCVLETADAERFSNDAYQMQPTFSYLEPLLARDLVQLFYSHIIKYPKLELNIFQSGYRRALDAIMRGMTPKATFWDFTYFRHYRNVIGGRMRLLYVDGPSTPSANIEWLRIIHGAKVVPIFGTLHTSAVATAGAYFDYASAIETHNVGAPLACNEIKLVDYRTADLALTAADKPYPRGRIAVRGPNVAATFWNSEPALPLNDGWLELPLFGELLPNGTLDVIGSAQTAFASALSPSGELFVERIENALAASRAVTDVCVVPEPGAKRLSIVAHPRPMELFAEAKKAKKTYRMKDIQNYSWCSDFIRAKLIEKIRSDRDFAWIADLPAKDIRVKLVSAPFSVANNLALQDGSNNRSAAKALLTAD